MTSEAINAELKLVRRGLGLYHPGLGARIGPALREACGVVDNDPAETVRSKVATRLRDASTALPGELSTAALAALGLHPEVRGLQQLQERVDWLAGRLRRDVRTARRRVDEACAMLAEIVAVGRTTRRTGGRAGGWYVQTAQTAMLLDTDTPTAVERQVVVAEHDGVDSLVLSRTVPPAGAANPDAHAQVLFGGVLGVKEWETSTRFRLVLELPVTLRAGDRHEYAIVWRHPYGEPMRPHYAYMPMVRCDHFDLHVRFDRGRPPERVWRVNDAFPRDLDEAPADRDLMELDRSGEVHAEFHELAAGHGYGVRWEQRTP